MENKLKKDEVEDIVALTPLQQGMLFHCISDSKSQLYFTQMEIELSGQFHFDNIKAAWQFVVKNNEILRTVYRWEKVKHPVQIVLKDKEIPITFYDLRKIGNQREEINKTKERAKKTGIDIRYHPMTIIISQLEEDKWNMIINNHHILFDGWSSGIMMKEFLDNYKGATCC